MIKKEFFTQMSEKEKFNFLMDLREARFAAQCCFQFELDEDLEYFEKNARPIYEKLKTIFS